MEGITLGQIGAGITFLVAFISGITFLVKFCLNTTAKIVNKEISEALKGNNEATKCLLRSNITSKYYVYTELGEIPRYERENCIYMYSQYKAMGGNSYVAQIMEEINKLPIKK